MQNPSIAAQLQNACRIHKRDVGRDIELTIDRTGHLLSLRGDLFAADGGTVPAIQIELPKDGSNEWKDAKFGVPGDTARFPPLDLSQDLFETLSVMPGVTVAWKSVLSNTPYGIVSVAYSVEDGRLRNLAFGDDQSPADAMFHVDVRRSIQSRMDGSPAAHIVGSRGRVEGEVEAMMLVAGIIDLPSWRNAIEMSDARGNACLALADLASERLFDALLP